MLTDFPLAGQEGPMHGEMGTRGQLSRTAASTRRLARRIPTRRNGGMRGRRGHLALGHSYFGKKCRESLLTGVTGLLSYTAKTPNGRQVTDVPTPAPHRLNYGVAISANGGLMSSPTFSPRLTSIIGPSCRTARLSAISRGCPTSSSRSAPT